MERTDSNLQRGVETFDAKHDRETGRERSSGRGFDVTRGVVAREEHGETDDAVRLRGDREGATPEENFIDSSRGFLRVSGVRRGDAGALRGTESDGNLGRAQGGVSGGENTGDARSFDVEGLLVRGVRRGSRDDKVRPTDATEGSIHRRHRDARESELREGRGVDGRRRGLWRWMRTAGGRFGERRSGIHSGDV